MSRDCLKSLLVFFYTNSTSRAQNRRSIGRSEPVSQTRHSLANETAATLTAQLLFKYAYVERLIHPRGHDMMDPMLGEAQK